MGWNVVDILVVGVFVANIAMLIWIGVAGFRLYKGPITTMRNRVKPLIASGKEIADAGQGAFGKNRDRFEALLTEFKGIAESIKPGDDGSGQLPINYKTLLTALTVVRVTRQSAARLRGKKLPPRKPSMAHRMGLVPPILVKLAPVLGLVRIFLNVRKTLRGRI